MLKAKFLARGGVQTTLKCDERRVKPSRDEATIVTETCWSETQTFTEDLK